jgi:hypothetical protein
MIYIAGVPYTIDQIYLALYGNDLDRQKGLGPLFDYLNGNLTAQQKVADDLFFAFTMQLQESEYTEEYTKDLAKALKDYGSENIKNWRSNEEAIKKWREMRENEAFNRYVDIENKQLEKQKHLENLEGCKKLETILELTKSENPTWKESTKIDFVKQKIKDASSVEVITCNNETKYFIKVGDFDFAKQSAKATKTIVDNPDYFNN